MVNRRRIHSSIGYLTPKEYELEHARQAVQTGAPDYLLDGVHSSLCIIECAFHCAAEFNTVASDFRYPTAIGSYACNAQNCRRCD